MRRKGTFQIWAEFAAIKALMWLLRALPRSASVALGRATARGAFRVLGSRLRSGVRSLEIAFPEMPEHERRRILEASIENIGRTVVEFANFLPTNGEESKRLVEFDFEGEQFQLYKKAKADGRGVLMPTAHIGNWELVLAGFSLQYEPIYFTARELDNPRIDKMFTDMRARFGNRQFYKSDSAKEVLKSL